MNSNVRRLGLLPNELRDFIQIRREEQKGRQRRGTDGIALGESLGGVAHRIQAVGALANLFRLRDISAMPPALSVMGPKVSMARM